MTTRNRILLGVAAGALGLFALLSLLRSGSGSEERANPNPLPSEPDRRVAHRLEQPETSPPVRAEEPEANLASDPAIPSKVESPPDVLALPEGTIAEMQVKRDLIKESLGERSHPILMQRLDDNLSEIVATGDSYSPTDEDMEEISALRREPGGPWYRTALPRSDYPELYELKAAIKRLDKQMDDVRRQDELARKRD